MKESATNRQRKHWRTQDFTMAGFHRRWVRNCIKGRSSKGSVGRKSHSEVQGKSPCRGSWGRRSPDAEAKGEISVQFLTFSCTTFRIDWVEEQSLDSIFYTNTKFEKKSEVAVGAFHNSASLPLWVQLFYTHWRTQRGLWGSTPIESSEFFWILCLYKKYCPSSAPILSRS